LGKRVDIKGLTDQEVQMLHVIAKEKKYSSLNAFLLDQVRLLIDNQQIDEVRYLYYPHLVEMNEVNKLILEKLIERERLHEQLTEKVKVYQDLVSRWLEFEGYNPEEMGI